MDFTLHIYENLLKNLINKGYYFQTVTDFITNPKQKVVVLRHDVDRLAINSLKTAILENNLNIKGTYYFRIVKESFNKDIIKKIYDLGHEIGYHYEDLTIAKGNIDKAYELFCKNLKKLRSIVPINTICMHGSPTSRWDNRQIWLKYDYKNLDIIGEPYLDIDFNEVLYLTDTGRCWNGNKYSIRDKVSTNRNFNYNLKTTFDLINAIKTDSLPDKIMITIHPQRWTNNPFTWTKEFILQNIKNYIKAFLILKHNTK